jgi:hypothetical protein
MAGLTSLFISFMIAGVMMANALGSRDVEPDMATLSLWLFCLIGALIAVASAGASAKRFRRNLGRVVGLITGVLSATAYFAMLALVHRGVGLPIAFLLACLAAAAVASISPFARPAPIV